MSSPKNLFEEYLKDQFMETYMGTDDDAPDKFEHWLSQLETDDWLRLGSDFIKKTHK